MRDEGGFTLIEVILSLMLFGILSVTAGLWLVTGVQGFVTTRENVAISQKAQAAMARMDRELSELTDIDSGNSNQQCIVYRVDPLSPFFRVLTARAGELVLKVDETGDCSCGSCADDEAHVLLNQVNSFQLAYEDVDGNVTTVPPVGLEKLALIQIQFELARTDGEAAVHSFSLAVNPRNNLNSNAP
ncbi:MAG: PulJ/GspJ family protein [Thermodesulfobacteriota bacterium]